MENITLKSIFIFDPSLKSNLKKPSEEEQQNAKLLYYYPNNEDIIIKRSNIGIIEGTIGFLDAFEISDDKFIITEMTKCLYIGNKFENDKYIVMLLNREMNEFSFDQSIELKKIWYNNLLKYFYDLFSLYNGPIHELFFADGDIREKDEYNNIQSIINDFVENFFESLLIGTRIPFLDNILYFPLNEVSYSQVLLSSQRLQEKIPEIKFSSIIFRGYLLHNEIPLDTFSLLYNSFFCNTDSSQKFSNFTRPPYKVAQTVFTGDNIENESDKRNSTSFRKSFDITGNSSFLVGINKLNINNYHVFIPSVYIKSLGKKLKLIIYLYNGIMLFLLLDDNFNYSVKLNSLIKLEKWMKRYFDEELPILENLYLQKTSKLDTFSFAYINNFNKSIKLSSTFINKKNKIIEKEKLDLLINIFKINYQENYSSLMKIKGSYVYYISTGDRKVIIFLSDNLSFNSITPSIEDIKKELFDYIYIL